MNRLAFTFITLLFFAQSVFGATLNPTFSGSWYNPDQSGHGLSVEVLNDDTTLIYWYVYHTDGTPQFLITLGSNNGNTVTGTTYYQSGMKFGEFDPNDLNQVVWGQATFTVQDCRSATFSYASDDPEYGSGSIQMVRLTDIEGIKCTNYPVQNNYHATLVYNNEAALGLIWIFENGYTAFWGVGPSGGVTAFGETKILGSDRYEMNLYVYDLLGSGWDEEYVSGEFSKGYIHGNFKDGSLIGTSLQTFQRTSSYSDASGTFDIFNLVENKIIGSVTLDESGNINGTTFSGCSLSGWYIFPDNNFNQMYTEIDVSGCSERPEMWGVGNYDPEGDVGFALSDGYNGKLWIFQR